MINAADVTSASQDAIARVTEGFQDLVSRTYTQLNLLGGITYSEQQVAGFANPAQEGLVDDSALSKLAVPGDEVLSFVLRRDGMGEQVTVKTIVDTFQAKPYGWDLASLEVVVAWLVGASKITLTVDGNVLKRSEVATVLRNTQKHSHAVVAPQKSFDEGKVSAFRKFCADFFDESTAPKDPQELARHGSDKLRAKLDELKATMVGSKYPFVQQLTPPIELLEQVVGKPDQWYVSDFNLGDGLLDAKENVVDPIQSFLNGGQRAIYDDGLTLLSTNANNLGYLPVGSDTAVRKLLDDPNAFRGNRMAELKQAANALRAKTDEVVTEKRSAVGEAIKARKSELLAGAYYAKATESAQQSVLQTIDQAIARVGGETQIALIREQGAGFEELVYPSLLDQLAASIDPSPVKQTVYVKTITVPGAHGVLENSEDVERYLVALRSALLDTLNNGKRIAL